MRLDLLVGVTKPSLEEVGTIESRTFDADLDGVVRLESLSDASVGLDRFLLDASKLNVLE